MLNKKLGVSITILMLGLFTIGCSKEAKAQYEKDITEVTENITGTQDIEQDEVDKSIEGTKKEIFDEVTKENNNTESSQANKDKDLNEDKTISKEEAIEIVEKKTGLSSLIYIDLENFDGFEHFKDFYGKKFHQIEGSEEEEVFFVEIHSGVIYVIDPEVRTLVTYDQWLEKIKNL